MARASDASHRHRPGSAQLDLRFARFFLHGAAALLFFSSPVNCSAAGSFSLSPGFFNSHRLIAFRTVARLSLAVFSPAAHPKPRTAIARAIRILLGQYDFTSISDYWAASRKEKLEPSLNGFALTVRFGSAAGISHRTTVFLSALLHLPFVTMPIQAVCWINLIEP